MTLQDVGNGSSLVGWFVFGILAIITIVLLSGHGGKLIAGYNTANAEEKAKYDEKKLSRICGCGMAVITILIFVTMLWEAVLPASMEYIFGGVCLVDVALMIICMNTLGKKK